MSQTEQNVQISIDDLSIKLVNFNGPLDLLLHLVKEDKIEIKDIFISQVTQQFLGYMTQLDSLDIDKASEYMAMSATLLEIKSRALIPHMPGSEDEENTPEKILIRQLEEYKLFVEVSDKLKHSENVDRLYKEPDVTAEENFSVKDMSLDSLLDAFAGILHKVELRRFDEEHPKQIKKDTFSVVEKLNYIKTKLTVSQTVDFMELCDIVGNVEEVVVTFVALLELMKHQRVTVAQSENFDTITVTRCVEGDLLDYEEFN